MTDYTPTDWQQKGVAVAGYTLAIIRTSPHLLQTNFRAKLTFFSRRIA